MNNFNYTHSPWKYTIENGDKNGNYPDKTKTYVIESDTRSTMFISNVWLFKDDPNIFEEVENNCKIVSKSPELYEISKEILNVLKNKFPLDEESNTLCSKLDGIIKEIEN